MVRSKLQGCFDGRSAGSIVLYRRCIQSGL
jgi:hypothetical protein